MPKIFSKEQDRWHLASSVIFIGLSLLLISILERRGGAPHSLPLFDAVILVLATFRLIRLFTYDAVMSWVRDYFGQFEKGPRRTIHSLLDCPWCSGVWMALLVSYLYFLVSSAWPLLLVLALAGAGSFLQIVIWKIGVEPPWYKKR